LVTSTTVPLIWLRALMRMAVLTEWRQPRGVAAHLLAMGKNLEAGTAVPKNRPRLRREGV
jgi:hypothetical protein